MILESISIIHVADPDGSDRGSKCALWLSSLMKADQSDPFDCRMCIPGSYVGACIAYWIDRCGTGILMMISFAGNIRVNPNFGCLQALL